MTAPEIRRARKGETRCDECLYSYESHSHEHQCEYAHVLAARSGMALLTTPPRTRRDNTCQWAQKREGDS